jgi:neutral amino acid transport system permease protein
VLQTFIGNLLPALVSADILPFMTTIQAATVRFILTGIALMLIVIFRPQGILGNKKELTFVK